MVKVIVQHHVADYGRWYPTFTEHGTVRRQHGATGHTIYRDAADPDTIIVVNEFATEAGARAFMTDPSLRDAMARAGVDSEPTIWVVTQAEDVRY